LISCVRSEPEKWKMAKKKMEKRRGKVWQREFEKDVVFYNNRVALEC